MIEKQKILILGGSKFMGRQLVEKLLEQDNLEIFIFNRGKTNPDIFPGVQQIIGDRNKESIARIGDENWDYVVDFSNYYPDQIEATLKHLNRNIKKYILISSISAYSLRDYLQDDGIQEDCPLKDCSPEEAMDQTIKTYGQRKSACEQLASQTDWLNSVILRPSIVYGKYDHTDRFYYWIYKLKQGQPIILPDFEKDQMTLTYAADLINIIIECIDQDTVTGDFNCSTHELISLRKLVQGMASALNMEPNFYPIAQEWLLEKEVKPQFDLPLWFGDNLNINSKKLATTLNFTFTPFQESINKTVSYFEEAGLNHQPSTGINLEREKELIELHRSHT